MQFIILGVSRVSKKQPKPKREQKKTQPFKNGATPTMAIHSANVKIHTTVLVRSKRTLCS